jgi:ComF family protein
MGLLSCTDRALIALFAPLCAACHAPLDSQRTGPVCLTCWSAIRPAPEIPEARSAGIYEGSLRQIIHALKYRGQASLARPLGVLMREAAGDWLDDAVLVPVPLHPWRSLRRGFNQADLLACALESPVWRPLRRHRLGRPQAGLHADERRANVADVYVMKRWRRGHVPATVVLVDDVLTTGATADACARVLHDAGVERVRVLTAARALPPATNSGQADRLNIRRV